MAISPQSIKFSRRIAREKNLSFPVLSDEGNEVAGQFGLVFELPEYLRSKYKELGADLERFNGEDSWTLPMPARYLIGSDRTIHWADVNPDYMQRPEPRETLEALRDLPPKG